MSGIKRPAMILAESEETYTAAPNPYKSEEHPKLDLPALSAYAKSVGKQINELSKEELARFT